MKSWLRAGSITGKPGTGKVSRTLLTLALSAGFLASMWGTFPASARTLSADDLKVVHCLLPGQVRQLGTRTTYVSPRKPVRVPAIECRQRGGEYVLGTMGVQNPAQLWLPPAQQGDAHAQATLASIYAQGDGVPQNLSAAAEWYARAADQAHSGAMISLGNLYEQGQGVARDPDIALQLYQQATGLPSQAATQTLALDTAFSGQGYNPGIAGPTITLIEPALQRTRGLVKVSASELAAGRTIIGRASAPAGLMRLTINDKAIGWNAAGVFEYQLDENVEQLNVVAIDQQGKRADVRLMLGVVAASPDPEAPPNVKFGRYHALLIGNSRYRHLPALRTPPADVAAIGEVLKNRYGFEVTTFLDTSRYELLSALNTLRQRLTSEDNLLIYYAGHGELDSTNNRGHWLPVDAELESTANWVSNVTITDMLNLMAVRQLLMVADSCYSGTLTRSSIARLDAGLTSAERDTWLRSMLSKKARVVLSSGGVAPVMDEGGGNHSVFAKAFLDVLSSQEGLLSGRDLYQALAARVTYAADTYRFEQLPQYAPIARAGHESGDFFFVPRIVR